MDNSLTFIYMCMLHAEITKQFVKYLIFNSNISFLKTGYFKYFACILNMSWPKGRLRLRMILHVGILTNTDNETESLYDC